MITGIEIENFKGIGKDVQVPIRPITLLFGANSAGKSTILHAMQYAYEVLVHQNLNADITERGGNALNLGGFQNFVHDRDLSKTVSIAFELNLEDAEDIPFFFPESHEDSNGEIDGDLSAYIKDAKISFSIAWDSREQRPQVTEYCMDINGQYAASIHHEVGRKEVVLRYDAKHPLAAIIWDGEYINAFEMWEDIQIANLSTAIPVWGKALEYAIKPDSEYLTGGEFVMSQVLAGVGEVFVSHLKRLRHIGPIRDIIPRHYEAVTSSVEGRWFEGRAAWDYLLTRATRADLKNINEWMMGGLNIGYEIAISSFKETHPLKDNSFYSGQLKGFNDSLKSIGLHDPIKTQNFRFYDVGVGVSQLMPIVVASLMGSTKILAVEQPELHVHPSIQVGLGDLFASQIKERDCLFLIETHSEHLILRLLRRIREASEGELPEGAPQISHDDVSIVYVDNNEDGMKITSIGITEDGGFTNRWPEGFFDERAEELF